MNDRGWNQAWRWVWIGGTAALLAVGGCRRQQKPEQPKPPSPEAVALHALADQTRLETLRWPNFGDLKQPVEEFYGAHNFEPVWLKGKKPTEQARQMMAAFAACGTDGLDPQDYDSAPVAARDSAPAAARDSAPAAARDSAPVAARDSAPAAARDSAPAAAQDSAPSGAAPGASRWEARVASIKTAQDRAAFDMAMTVSAMRYLNDEHNGRVDPTRFNFGVDIKQKRYDLAKFLTEKIIASGNVGAVLVTVPPQSNEYKRTLAAYRHWVELAKQDPGGGLPPVARQMKPGDAYAGAARMRELLMLDGDLKDDAPDANAPDNAANTEKAAAPAKRYDPAWAAAVRHFQFHHGLQADGKIGPPTIAAMNVPTAERAHQLAIALERWRWLPDVYQNAPIFVNLPEFKLRVYSDEPPPAIDLKPAGVQEVAVVHASERPAPADMTSDHTKIALEMNVVTGKAGIKPPEKKGEQPEDHQTPMLVNLMRYLIFRPYWSVPIDITQREVLPGIAKDPNYLAEHDFEIVDHRRKPVDYTPKLDKKLLHGELMVRQVAGPDNSLGLVKFMFPNPYSIYLHSTPAVGLFTRTRRDFSHGCVRVEKPLPLAAWILRDRQDWTPDKIDDAMNIGDDNKTVVLKQTIPVTIFYDTAYVEADGTVDFTRDIYEYDKLLDETLALGRPYPTKPIAPVVDVHDER
ncbi:MAG TPA: L,D-transpeptidase family protein [Acidobacteriaceae bacterium]|jgi:murein L,D-transpeptidase YcbB/YkuD